MRVFVRMRFAACSRRHGHLLCIWRDTTRGESKPPLCRLPVWEEGFCRRSVPRGSCWRERTDALCTGRRLEKLLLAQLGERMMSCSPQQGVFLTKAARSGHTVVFSTRACPQNADAILTLQASLSFAARAAMARPPFLSAMDWMGAPLLPVDDADFACRLLLKMGAQRVLVIAPGRIPFAMNRMRLNRRRGCRAAYADRR